MIRQLHAGNYNSGFIYNVTWYGDGTMNELDCANKKLDHSILDEVVKLANSIDK